jgi:hypothetical protein
MSEKIYEGIAICGSNPATIGMAPFDDERWIIYACSPHNFEHRKLPRFDEWFEDHIPVADKTRAYPYLKYLETLPFVWMRDKDAMPHFSGARPFPDDEMRERWGPFHHTSSISLMQMRAISECERLYAEGKMPEPKIAYFGIMQRGQTEYLYQRPSIQQLALDSSREDHREKFDLPVIKHYAPDISELWEPMPETW